MEAANFPIQTIDLADFYYTQEEAKDHIWRLLQEQWGVSQHQDDLLFTGIEATPVLETGTLGHRRSTFAATSSAFWESTHINNPLNWALNADVIETPGLLILEADKLFHPEDVIYDDYYELKPHVPHMDVVVRSLVVIEGV